MFRPIGWALLAAAIALPRASWAQEPSRPTVRIVVPYTTGGGIDVLARLLGQRLAELRGQAFVIENRPGGGATVGTAQVARAAPDGTSFVIVSNTFALGAVTSVKPPYDVLRDFVPVTMLTRAPFVLAVPPSLGARSVSDLVEISRVRPGGLNFASSGTGTSSHLAIELLKYRTGLSAVHVPYKGSQAALIDLVAGRVDAFFATPVAILPMAGEGKLVAMATTGAQRSPVAPQLPTVAEAGVSGYELVVYFGLLAPAATPTALVERLHADARTVLALPEVMTQLRSLGQDPVAMPPEAFARYLRDEIMTWTALVAKTGLNMD